MTGKESNPALEEYLSDMNREQAAQEKPVTDFVESNSELSRFLADVENGMATDGGIDRFITKWNADFIPLAGGYWVKRWKSPRGIEVYLKVDENGHTDLGRDK